MSDTTEVQQKILFWRILQIDACLQDGKPRTAAALARMLEVSTRTIQRDIEFMRDSMRVLVESGRDGYRYAVPQSFIKSIPLTEGELFSLAVLSPLLEQYRNTPLEAQLRSVFKKLLQSLPDTVSVDATFLNPKITFIPDRTEAISEQLFHTVFGAVKSCRALAFDYRPLQKSTFMRRLVDPYHIVCQRGNWYLIGYCHHKQDVRIFSLSRMKGAELTQERFSVPAAFHAEDYFDAELGVWLSDKTPFTVELLVDKEIGTYALNRVWHSGQTVEERDDGSVYVRFQTTQKQEVVRWVLGQGHTVRVLAPQSLADEVRAEALRTAALYATACPAAL